MTPHQRPTVEVLLEDVNWVRGLARNLVRDTVLAEDAAQEAWLAALRKTPAPRSTLRAWLAGATRNAVLKACRSERRRSAHEEVAARSIRVSSTEEVVEDLSTQLEVAQAVNGLEEPLRETLLLRYYEGLSLKEIARRMGVPVSTAAARAQRGLKVLRVVLERRLGAGGRNWVQALLPMLERDAAMMPRVALLPSAAVAGRLAIAAVAALAVSIGVREILMPRDGLTLAPVTHERSDEVADVDWNTAVTKAPVVGQVARRDAIGAASSSAAVDEPVTQNGSLLVRVLHSDETPAVDLTVEVRRADVVDPSRPAFRLRTDSQGSLTLDDLPVGDWVVAPVLGGVATVNVPALVPVSVTLHLPSGPALSGLVIDAQGEPVPGAGIWISLAGAQEMSLGRFVQTVVRDEFIAQTDGNGAFRLASIGAAQMIGARAAGYSPSDALSLPVPAGAEVELRLALSEAGGSVSGLVLDPVGVPLKGASIVLEVSRAEASLHGTWRPASRHPLVRTDSDIDGHFRIRGVQPGSRRIVVRAPGLAPWQGKAEVRAHDDTRVDVCLQRGMTIVGLIADPAGVPLEGVLVWGSRRRWTDALDLRQAVRTRTDSRGRYRIDGLEVGQCWVTVDGGERGRDATMLLGDGPGEVVHDVTLEPCLELRGRVLDERGGGIPGISVKARLPGDWRFSEAFTDGVGAFAITGLEDSEYLLWIAEDGLSLRRDLRVWPAEDEATIQLDDMLRPSVTITGVVTEADGSDAAWTSVRLERVGDGWVLERLIEREVGGSSRTLGFPPGCWRIVLQIEGHPDLPIEGQHTLVPHQVLDLGHVELRLDPGVACRLRIRSAQGVRAPERVRLRVRSGSGELLLEKTVLPASATRDFQFSETIDLPPGVYGVEAGTEDSVARGTLRVVQGMDEHHLDLLLEPR